MGILDNTAGGCVVSCQLARESNRTGTIETEQPINMGNNRAIAQLDKLMSAGTVGILLLSGITADAIDLQNGDSIPATVNERDDSGEILGCTTNLRFARHFRRNFAEGRLHVSRLQKHRKRDINRDHAHAARRILSPFHMSRKSRTFPITSYYLRLRVLLSLLHFHYFRSNSL